MAEQDLVNEQRHKSWLSEAFGLILRPTEASFNGLLAASGASLAKAVLGLLICSLIGYEIFTIGNIWIDPTPMPGPDLFHEVFPYYAPFFLGFILVVFFVWISILYLIGSVFGGEGTIPLIGKLVGYYTAPLILISLPLGLVEVGKYFLVLIGIFFVYLTVLTVKITHQHNWAKAIIVCLISLLIACPAMARVIGRPFLF